MLLRNAGQGEAGQGDVLLLQQVSGHLQRGVRRRQSAWRCCSSRSTVFLAVRVLLLGPRSLRPLLVLPPHARPGCPTCMVRACSRRTAPMAASAAAARPWAGGGAGGAAGAASCAGAVTAAVAGDVVPSPSRPLPDSGPAALPRDGMDSVERAVVAGEKGGVGGGSGLAGRCSGGGGEWNKLAI